MYMCAVDKLLCEFIWGRLLYSDANPLSPLSSLPKRIQQLTMLFLVHKATETTQTKPPMT